MKGTHLAALLLLAGVCPLLCAAEGEVTARASGGPTLEQLSSGDWVQRVHLRGWAQPGLTGLREAFSRQLVTVECPSSQKFDVLVSTERRDEHAGAVGGSVGWSTRRHCGATADGGEAGPNSDTTIGSCSVGVSLVGDTTLIVQQPGSQGASLSSAPEPCTLTVQRGISPPLLLACTLGTLLVLRGRRWARNPVVVALIRINCVLLPLLSALLCAVLLASLAILSTAAVEWVLTQLPVQPPRELWGTAVVAVAAVTGVGTALSLIMACMAVQMRGWAVAAGPWVAQLLGLALICSNSSALNWVMRGACILWLIRSSRQAAAGQTKNAGR